MAPGEKPLVWLHGQIKTPRRPGLVDGRICSMNSTKKARLEAAGWKVGTAAEFLDLNERSEEHTSELQSQSNLVCRLLLEKKKKNKRVRISTKSEDIRSTVHRSKIGARRA